MNKPIKIKINNKTPYLRMFMFYTLYEVSVAFEWFDAQCIAHRLSVRK